MTGRHTRTPVWLTRLRAPFATTSARELPLFDQDPNPLTAEAEALDHLAPRVRVAKPTSPARSLIRRVRGIRFTRPTYTGSILPRPTEPVFRAAVTLLLGITLGYGYHAMTLQAPQDCARAFTLADRTFVDYENVSTAVVLMSTRGQSEYEGHEADAIQLWDDIDAARAEYRVAKASCLGADS